MQIFRPIKLEISNLSTTRNSLYKQEITINSKTGENA